MDRDLAAAVLALLAARGETLATAESLTGDREAVRAASVEAVLELLADVLAEAPSEDRPPEDRPPGSPG